MLLNFSVNSSNNSKGHPGKQGAHGKANQNPDSVAADQNNVEFIGSIPAAINTGAKVYSAGKTLQKAYKLMAKGDFEAAGETFNQADAQGLYNELKQAFTQPSNSGGGGKGTGRTPSFDVIPPRGGGDVPIDGGKSPFVANNQRLNILPHPDEIRLNTGIVPSTKTPSRQFTIPDYNSPYYLTGVEFVWPTSGSNTKDLFINAITPELRRLIRLNTTYKLDISAAQVESWLHKLTKALQYYYATTRYFTYVSESEGINDPKLRNNRNQGIVSVAESMSLSYQQVYTNLRRTLAAIPKPPDLNEILFILFQNYSFSDLPLSPIIALNPIPLTTDGYMDWSKLQDVLRDIREPDFQDMCDIITTAIPSWNTTKLLTGFGDTLHDPNFTTLWTNLPYSAEDDEGNMVKGPKPDSSGSIKYNVWTERLDGAVIGMVSMFDGTSEWLPSFLKPVTSVIGAGPSFSNRFHFDTSRFYDSMQHPYFLKARCETYCMPNFQAEDCYPVCHNGSMTMVNVSIGSVEVCADAFADYLIGWDSVNVKVNKNLGESKPQSFSDYKFTKPGKGSFKTNKPKTKGKKGSKNKSKYKSEDSDKGE